MVERRLKLTSNRKPKTEAARNRTNPIKDTIHTVKQLHHSAIIYKCAASNFWHFRVFLDGAQRKRSTKETDIEKAMKQAKVIFAQLLLTINDTDGEKNKLSSTKTLDVVAKSLYSKQQVMIEQGELEKNKNKKERYVYEKHIRPYFAKIELKKINADELENFKIHLAKKGLAQSTQKGYLDLVGKLLKEAAKKEYISRIPIMPSVKTHDDPRGNFNSGEYSKLWHAALRYKNKMYEFKYKDGAAKSDKTYRKTRITSDCFHAIMFMRNTFIRPTDLKFIKHKDVFVYERDGITLLELRHGRTKGHSNYMASTENAIKHYTLANSPKVTLINFDLTRKHCQAFLLKLAGNNLTQPMKKEGSCLTINSTQTRSSSRGRARNKMFNQSVLFINAQTALAHSTHNNPFSELSGTAPKDFIWQPHSGAKSTLTTDMPGN